MVNRKENIKANSFLIALFIMQYTLLLPFTKVLPTSSLTAGTGILILFLFVILNHGKIWVNWRYILILAAVILAILLKVVLFPSSDTSIFLVFAYTAFPAAFAASYHYDARLVLKNLYKISLFSFPLIFWYPFIGKYSYMRFGYGVLPSVMFILSELFFDRNKPLREKIIAWSICIILLVEMVIKGARGCFFSLLLFFAVEELLINRKNLTRKIVLALGAFTAYLNIDTILTSIFNMLSAFGIRSYAIIKYRMQLNRGFEAASSGRDHIYDSTIDQLMESPFLGLPLSLGAEEGNISYVHNLFLQTWMDMGMIGLAVLVVFILFVLWKIWRKDIDRNERILIAAVFSVSIGRLMFSSVIWRRPEFWLLVFMSMKMNRRRCTSVEEKEERIKQ